MSRAREHDHDGRRTATDRRLWTDGGKPSRVFQAFKTGLLVTIVSVLIWVWAEGESLKVQEAGVRLAIGGEVGAGDLVVSPAQAGSVGGGGGGGGEVLVQVRLEGPTAAVDAVTRRLAAGRIMISAGMEGVPGVPGIGEVNVREAVGAGAGMLASGVTILEAQPARLPVRVARLVERTMPIRVESAGIDFDGVPAINPPTVSVRMPVSLAAVIPETSSVLATISAADKAMLRAGVSVEVRCGLQLDPESCKEADAADVALVRFGVESVQATMTVRLNVDSITLQGVPVWVSLAGAESALWAIELLDPVLNDVVVTGPSETIEQIRGGRISLRAQVELTRSDLESGMAVKTYSFVGMPAGASLDIKSPKTAIGVKARRN